MKKSEVRIGRTYAVKVSNKIAPVTLGTPHPFGGWYGYNNETGRAIRIRSAARLRYEVVPAVGEASGWVRVVNKEEH